MIHVEIFSLINNTINLVFNTFIGLFYIHFLLCFFSKKLFIVCILKSVKSTSLPNSKFYKNFHHSSSFYFDITLLINWSSTFINGIHYFILMLICFDTWTVISFTLSDTCSYSFNCSQHTSFIIILFLHSSRPCFFKIEDVSNDQENYIFMLTSYITKANHNLFDLL